MPLARRTSFPGAVADRFQFRRRILVLDHRLDEPWTAAGGIEEIGGLMPAVHISRDGRTIVGAALDNQKIQSTAIWLGGRIGERLAASRVEKRLKAPMVLST